MRNWTGTILTLSLFASAAQAHHSLSNYDQGRDVRADGVVEEFHFVNPHPFLMIGVTDPSGVRQIWRLEMDNLHELDEIGISKTTFKPGDRVTSRQSRQDGTQRDLSPAPRPPVRWAALRTDWFPTAADSHPRTGLNSSQPLLRPGTRWWPGKIASPGANPTWPYAIALNIMGVPRSSRAPLNRGCRSLAAFDHYPEQR
jgi:hypothetical protein